jgi:hypothetical protein
VTVGAQFRRRATSLSAPTDASYGGGVLPRAYLRAVDADVIEILDRQHDLLQRQDGVRLILHLPRFFRFLETEPRLAAIAADLAREATETLEAFRQHECDVVRRFVPLRDEFASLAPDADDSSLSPPPADDRTGALLEYRLSLARFDAFARRVLESGPDLPEFEADRVRTTASEVIEPVIEKIRALRWYQDVPGGLMARPEGDSRPELEDVNARMLEVQAQHRVAVTTLRAETTAGGAFALMRLRYIVEELYEQLAFLQGEDRKWQLHLFRQRFGSLGLQVLGHHLHGYPGSELVGGNPAERLTELCVQMRSELELLCEELRRAVGTARSRLGLVHRFRTRCEWYDRDELLALAGSSPGPEDALTARLARFLFDQGLNPLTRPLTGRLEPDLLDPTRAPTFYVEAKQYVSDARRELREGVWQAHDTLATLRSGPYEVREGFYVVFRRGGPRYRFPTSIPGEGWVLYPVLVDLAEDVGSRVTRAPAAFTLDELLPPSPPST